MIIAVWADDTVCNTCTEQRIFIIAKVLGYNNTGQDP